MNWEAIGAIGEIIGAVAVVGTLGYLALQIRHSSNQSLANMATTSLNEFNRMQETLIANPHTAEILLKLRTGEDLSQLEETIYESIANRYITHWFQTELAYNRGLIEKAMFNTMCEDVVRTIHQCPPIRNKFREVLSYYSVASSLRIFEPIYDLSDQKT